jgi:hypothetical protein
MPKRGSDYAKRPALPANSRSLRPEEVVVAALAPLKDALYEDALKNGDEELREALLYVALSRLVGEGEAMVEEIEKKTGFTKPSALRVIADRRERQQLVERHGNGWHSLNAKMDNDIDVRAGLKPAKRSAA